MLNVILIIETLFLIDECLVIQYEMPLSLTYTKLTIKDCMKRIYVHGVLSLTSNIMLCPEIVVSMFKKFII